MIRIKSKLDGDVGLDMTPLIDAVFILLLFFILAATFTVRGLDVELPQAQITGRIVEIRLFADGRFTVDDVPTAREDLPYKVSELVRTMRNRPGQLVLLSDPKAPVEALVFLVDQVRRNGGEKLMVAASAPKEN